MVNPVKIDPTLTVNFAHLGLTYLLTKHIYLKGMNLLWTLRRQNIKITYGLFRGKAGRDPPSGLEYARFWI